MKRQLYLPVIILAGLTALAVIATLVLPGLIRRAQPRPLTLLVSDWPGDQIFAFIDLLNLDSPYQLDLDLRRAPLVDDQLAAWRLRQTHLQLSTLDLAFAAAETDEIRLIYAYDDSFGADGMLVVQSIQSPADLRGQTIGVEFGAPSHFLTLNTLAQAGLSPDEVTLVDVQFDEVEEAFESGRVAAVTTWEPNISDILAKRPDLRLLTSTRDFPELILNVVVVRESELRANRETYVNLIRAAAAATQQCNPNLTPCLERLAADTGRAAAQWQADFNGIRLLTLADNQRLFGQSGPGGLAARLQTTYDFLRANRPDMPAYDNLSQWLDGSVVAEVAGP
jgi:NitT/TauT family transport system substrate-binding protein